VPNKSAKMRKHKKRKLNQELNKLGRTAIQYKKRKKKNVK
jgi:hypothetical protein